MSLNWMENVKSSTGLSLVNAVRATDDREKWRKIQDKHVFALILVCERLVIVLVKSSRYRHYHADSKRPIIPAVRRHGSGGCRGGQCDHGPYPVCQRDFPLRSRKSTSSKKKELNLLSTGRFQESKWSKMR